MNLKHDKCGAFDEKIHELEKQLHTQGNQLQKLKLENEVLKMKLKDAIEALRFYDGVHRLNWAIDLNELSEVAQETISKIEGK